MTSAHVETPVTNNSPSQGSSHPDYHFQLRHIRVLWSLGKHEDLPRTGKLGSVY